VKIRDPIDKVHEARAKKRFIPQFTSTDSQPVFACTGLKYGGPAYLPTYQDYGSGFKGSRGGVDQGGAFQSNNPYANLPNI
jgi:hypothetical protein